MSDCHLPAKQRVTPLFTLGGILRVAGAQEKEVGKGAVA